LGEKRDHCSEVLSVAGFFAFISRFRLGRRFILRRREALSLRNRPLSFNPVTKSVKPGDTWTCWYHTHREAGRQVHGEATYPPWYREAYTRVYTTMV